MTAIPSTQGTVSTLLICDSCGRAYEGDTSLPWIVLWTEATGTGWHGRDRAIGPHSCTHCPA